MRRLRTDDGLSTLELGLLLPVLLVLLTAVMPIVKSGWEYMVASRAVAHGVRYATRVDNNARLSESGVLTRRPSASDVEAFVRDAAEPVDVVSVTTSPEPAGSLAGDLITVRMRYRTTFGLLSESREITVTARGREE